MLSPRVGELLGLWGCHGSLWLEGKMKGASRRREGKGMKCGVENEAENGRGRDVGEGCPDFRRDGRE